MRCQISHNYLIAGIKFAIKQCNSVASKIAAIDCEGHKYYDLLLLLVLVICKMFFKYNCL